jgi:hypothetical protein
VNLAKSANTEKFDVLDTFFVISGRQVSGHDFG